MTKTKPSEKILQAMEIIGDRKRWTKGTFARDSNGVAINLWDSDAVCFCSIGALDKVKSSATVKHYVSTSVPLTTTTTYGFAGVVDFNDAPETKHKGVMNMFMTAAFLALSEGK